MSKQMPVITSCIMCPYYYKHIMESGVGYASIAYACKLNPGATIYEPQQIASNCPLPDAEE